MIRTIYLGMIMVGLSVSPFILKAQQAPARAAVRLTLQPPIAILINGIWPDEKENVFVMSIAISDPSQVSTLIVNVIDKESEVNVLDIVDKESEIYAVDAMGDEVTVNGQPTLIIPIKTANLEPGRDYIVQVKARNITNAQILRPDPNLPPDEAVILASRPLKREPLQSPNFQITSITPNWSAGKLIIEMDVQGTGEIANFEVRINNKNNNEVARFDGKYVGPQLLVDLPPNMRQSEKREYELVVYLTNWDKVRAEAIKPFTLEPETKKSLSEQVWTIFRQNPIILGICIVLATFVITWYVVGSRRKKHADPLAPPIFGHTDRIARASQPSARVCVIRTPGNQGQSEWVVRDFPCIIGRMGSDPKADLEIDDRRVSGRHLKIDLRGGILLLTDLESRNGTWLDGKQLESNTPARLMRTSVVRLGPDTEIELTPEM